MVHNVIIKGRYAGYNVDSYNRTAVCTVDVDNGCVFALKSYSENEGEGIVWKAEQAAANSKGLWMATSPEVVSTEVMDGVVIRGLVSDPRAFTNVADSMIDCIKLVPGDIIEMTGEGIADIEKAATTYLVPDVANFKLKAAAAAGNGLALRKIGTSKLHIADGAIAKKAVTTYKFEVEQN